MTKSRTPARRAGSAPVRKKRAKWTPLRMEKFFDALAESCNVRKACEAAGMHVSSAYKLKQRDASFMARWGEALHAGYDQVEMGLINRAIEGTQTRTVQNGPDGKPQYEKIVTTFHDPTAIHLLRLHRDEVEAVRRNRTLDAGTVQGIERARAVLRDIAARRGHAPTLPDYHGADHQEGDHD